MDIRKEIDGLIEESIKFPDLEIKQSKLGKVYDPNNDDVDENGYITIENIEFHPTFTKKTVTPRAGVGLPIPPEKTEILRHVEFLEYDEENLYGREISEFGFKFSKPYIKREPHGIVTILHEFGVKNRGADFRWTRAENTEKVNYIFMFVPDENDEKGGYYMPVKPSKKKNLEEWDPLSQMYYERLEKSKNTKILLNRYLHKYRTYTFKDYWVVKDASNGDISQDFHSSLQFHLDGRSTLKDVLNFITKTNSFLEDTIRFVKARMVIRKITIAEYNYLIDYLNDVKKAWKEAASTIQLLIEEKGLEASYFEINEDWYVDTDKKERERVLFEKVKKTAGPIQLLRSHMKRLLESRPELPKDIKPERYSVGYLYIDYDNKVVIPNVGEMIRSQYLYRNAAKVETEQKIMEFIFNQAKKEKAK